MFKWGTVGLKKKRVFHTEIDLKMMMCQLLHSSLVGNTNQPTFEIIIKLQLAINDLQVLKRTSNYVKYSFEKICLQREIINGFLLTETSGFKKKKNYLSTTPFISHMTYSARN